MWNLTTKPHGKLGNCIDSDNQECNELDHMKSSTYSYNTKQLDNIIMSSDINNDWVIIPDHKVIPDHKAYTHLNSHNVNHESQKNEISHMNNISDLDYDFAQSRIVSSVSNGVDGISNASEQFGHGLDSSGNYSVDSSYYSDILLSHSNGEDSVFFSYVKDRTLDCNRYQTSSSGIRDNNVKGTCVGIVNGTCENTRCLRLSENIDLNGASSRKNHHNTASSTDLNQGCPNERFTLEKYEEYINITPLKTNAENQQVLPQIRTKNNHVTTSCNLYNTTDLNQDKNKKQSTCRRLLLYPDQGLTATNSQSCILEDSAIMSGLTDLIGIMPDNPGVMAVMAEYVMREQNISILSEDDDNCYGSNKAIGLNNNHVCNSDENTCGNCELDYLKSKASESSGIFEDSSFEEIELENSDLEKTQQDCYSANGNQLCLNSAESLPRYEVFHSDYSKTLAVGDNVRKRTSSQNTESQKDNRVPKVPTNYNTPVGYQNTVNVGDNTGITTKNCITNTVDAINHISTVQNHTTNKDTSNHTTRKLTSNIKPTSNNTDLEKQKKSHIERLARHKQKQLSLIERRRLDLHRMIDSWYEQLHTQIEFTYEQEVDRVENRTSPGTSHVTLETEDDGDQTEKAKDNRNQTESQAVMCSVLNTHTPIQTKHFGFLKYHLTNGGEQEDISAYELECSATHVRTFESRDHDNLNTDYMATSLSVNRDGNYVISDLGADTCRVFHPSGRLLCDFDIFPLSEPSHVLCLSNGDYMVSCRDGIQLFNSKGELKSFGGRHSSTSVVISSDIKCPQSMAVDSKGNYLVSDMHDCGSVIVTLKQHSLKPLRLFCGSQYDPDTQEYFHGAWHIHVTRDDHVLLSDRDTHTLKCYSKHGEFRWCAGKQGSGSGEFITPAGIAEDSLGNILVADCGNERIQMFTSDGDWLAESVNSQTHGITSPVDVAVDKDGNLVVLQSDGGVAVFKYLQKIV